MNNIWARRSLPTARVFGGERFYRFLGDLDTSIVRLNVPDPSAPANVETLRSDFEVDRWAYRFHAV